MSWTDFDNEDEPKRGMIPACLILPDDIDLIRMNTR